MSIKVVPTPAGIVIREILPGSECAYRMTPEGWWDYSPDHKDRWHRVQGESVPLRFKDAFLAFSERYEAHDD